MNLLNKYTRRVNRQITKQRFLFALIFLSIPAFAVSARAAVYAVTTTADSGAGSLRAVVAAANTAATDDIIYFSIPPTDAGCVAGVCTVTLTSGEIVLTTGGSGNNLTINGTGGGSLKISGNNASRIFNYSSATSGTMVTLNGITFTNGKSTYGGAVANIGVKMVVSNSVFTTNTATGGGIAGGGLFCSGTCTVTNTTFSGNSAAVGYGGAIGISNAAFTMANSIINGNNAAYGGGIYHQYGTDTITNSTISGNTAGYGGAIAYDSAGTDYISNSTLNGNTTTSGGGAIYEFFSSVYLTDMTISDNSAGNGSGGALYDDRGSFYFTNCTVSNNYSKFEGGGIYAYTANVYESKMLNTIVAGNTSTTTTKDYYGPFQSLGGNIVGDSTNTTITGTTTGNQIGTTAAPVDAKLGSLAYNGGFNLTRSLLNLSPAINAGAAAGNASNVVPALDQRGAARSGATDIGAFEVSSLNFNLLLPNGNTTQYYNSQLVPDSGNFTYLVTSGTLPPGLILTPPLTAGGTLNLTGTPTLAGIYTFTVTGTDGVTTMTTTYTITINSSVTTAAGVSVSGRVLNFKGRGIANARLILTGGDGKKRAVLSNSFGYFSFEDASAGQTCIVSVQAKGYSFGEPSRVISLTNDLNGLNFNALP